MAGRKENLKALFSNTHSRVIILFTVALLLLTVIIGVVKFHSSTSMNDASAGLTSAPTGIESIPGSMNPTAQYAALQEEQNVEQAQVASKTGTSAIPTIIRTQAFGSGVQAIGPQAGQGAVGFSALAREEEAGPQQSLWLQALKDGNCNKNSVNQVVNQGAGLSVLKTVCSCLQLKENGYALTELQQVCSCPELKVAGFNARQLKDAGFDAGQLRECGFDACEERNAGFGAQAMKDGGFSDGELKGAGVPEQDINQAGGLPDGVTASQVRDAGCQVEALSRLRTAGVSAAAIRRMNGCSAAQLKAAGYTAADLKNAGFTAAQLKDAGLNAGELKQAGFTPRSLLNAGFSPQELAAAGVTPTQLATADAELPPGVTAEDIKNAGCSEEALNQERAAGISDSLIHQYAGCNAPSDAVIRAAGCDSAKLTALFKAGVSAKRIHDVNRCSAAALKAAGFSAKDLADAGFSPAELAAAGFSPDEVKAATPFSDQSIQAAGCDPTKLNALRAEGVTAQRIHQLNGCSAEALKAAGFNAKQLSDASFTPKQLLDAGFTPSQLQQAGISSAQVIAAGRTANCSVGSLKAARALGVSATTIRQTLGCNAEALKAAGYSAADIKAAGFTAAELKNAGFTVQDLKNAGFTAKELADAGFSLAQLKEAGFSAKALKDAGFTAAQLKNAGFSLNQLKDAGFTAKDLKDAGYSADNLRQAGYAAKSLKDAGFTADQLKNAGFSDQQLEDAGFPPQNSAVAGLPGVTTTTNTSSLSPLPSIAIGGSVASSEAENTKQLQAILKRQTSQLNDQKYQQKIQSRTSTMSSAANTALQDWKNVSTQVYISGAAVEGGKQDISGVAGASMSEENVTGMPEPKPLARPDATPALIKTGDVMFAVLDTSVNTDEPSPILATIVSGPYKGAKLIGSFTLPSNASKMVISFNTMSVPGAPKTTSINAYAIDPNTSHTALATSANHHYLLRYGSLFASTFLEGFGNAFQSANTTITIGGTGGVTNTMVQSGVGRSALENAVIGLATLGKTWGQVAQQQFSLPTTVYLCSGTALGILFTQDVTSL